jgi:hypothetical protein
MYAIRNFQYVKSSKITIVYIPVRSLLSVVCVMQSSHVVQVFTDIVLHIQKLNSTSAMSVVKTSQGMII